MHTKHLCLKHRQLDCKCGSPLGMAIGFRTRIPQKDKINQWKKFVKEYLSDEWLKRNNLDKEKIINSWK